VTVRYGQRLAVDDVAVTLHPGEVVALVGPNGAGSRAFCSPSRPASTPATCGWCPTMPTRSSCATRSPRNVAALTGGRTPVRTTVARFAALLGRGDEDGELRRRHPRDLSAGQRRCLALAIQTATRPAVLLVDEPTRTRPDARRMVDTALTRIADAGTAVLVATHDAAVVSAPTACSAWRPGRLSPTATATAAPATAPGEDRGATHRPAPNSSTREHAALGGGDDRRAGRDRRSSEHTSADHRPGHRGHAPR
jgi:energy-coupling factor transport system ATP-binding protein